MGLGTHILNDIHCSGGRLGGRGHTDVELCCIHRVALGVCVVVIKGRLLCLLQHALCANESLHKPLGHEDPYP